MAIAFTLIETAKLNSVDPQAWLTWVHRTVRHEWLDQNIFETIEEAQEQATNWLWTYNNDRLNMGIGGITPAMKLKLAA